MKSAFPLFLGLNLLLLAMACTSIEQPEKRIPGAVYIDSTGKGLPKTIVARQYEVVNGQKLQEFTEVFTATYSPTGQLTQRYSTAHFLADDYFASTLGGHTRFDGEGRVIAIESSTKAFGEEKLQYSYDPAGRLTTKQLINGNKFPPTKWVYTYNPNGTVAQVSTYDTDDQLITPCALFYTSQGQLESINAEDKEGSFNLPLVQYEYLSNGKLWSQTFPGETDLYELVYRYYYHSTGEVKEIKEVKVFLGLSEVLESVTHFSYEWYPNA